MLVLNLTFMNMDGKSREFFNALNRITNHQLDVIDVNHLTIDEILNKYNLYYYTYIKFLELQKNDNRNYQDTIRQKKQYDAMFKFWINPFHIALRNEIGALDVPKQEVERKTTDKGDGARLTKYTIDKIKRKHIQNLDKKIYTVNPQKLREEINAILEEIRREHQEKIREESEGEQDISEEYKNLVQHIDTYTFDVLPRPSRRKIRRQDKKQLMRYERVKDRKFMTSIISKYKIVLQQGGGEHSIEVYGEIDMYRFQCDKAYREVILEAIENAELESYENGLKTFNKKSNVPLYIGNFRSIVRDGKRIWQQEIRESDIDAMKKIENQDRLFKEKAINRNNFLKLGEDR